MRDVDLEVSSLSYAHFGGFERMPSLRVRSAGAVRAYADLLVSAADDTPLGVHALRGHVAYRVLHGDGGSGIVMAARETASKPDCHVFRDAAAGLTLSSPGQLRLDTLVNDRGAAAPSDLILEILLGLRSPGDVPLHVTGRFGADAGR